MNELRKFPVIRHKISKEKFIVAGEFYSNMSQRMNLVLFPMKEKHYITILGTYDNLQNIVYTNNRFEPCGDSILTDDQYEVLNTHLLMGMIERITEIRRVYIQLKLNFDN